MRPKDLIKLPKPQKKPAFYFEGQAFGEHEEFERY